jgi:hypothetical protein
MRPEDPVEVCQLHSIRLAQRFWRSTGGAEWELNVNQSLATDFDGITGPAEYVERQLAIIERSFAETDAAPVDESKICS